MDWDVKLSYRTAMESTRLTSKSRRRVRILHFCLTLLVFVNMFAVYKYFGEPFVEDPFLRRWDFLKFWITNQPLVFLFSLTFVFLHLYRIYINIARCEQSMGCHEKVPSVSCKTPHMVLL